MWLNNVTLLHGRHPVNIVIAGEKIMAIEKVNASAPAGNVEINFTSSFAFPGLINSHDHLDFNCFSPLGQKKYANYTEWGNHIHYVYKDDINAVLKIPLPLRARWGMYKNLLAGVTTVVNHGDVLSIEDTLITIYQQAQSLHSVKFQKNWRRKLNNPLLANKACVIHTGEGTDKQSADEIDELVKWNLFNRKLIGVHGVAMNPDQAKKFAALVWCPESNRVLLEKHADIAQLIENTRLVFGTDSTLTGNWNIWKHLRLARSLQLLSDEKLFSMLTSEAGALWGLNTGTLQSGKDADIVIARTTTGQVVWDDLFTVNPSSILLVLHKGKIRMFDKTLLGQLNSQHAGLKNFTAININGHIKFIEGDLPALIDSIKQYHPGATFPVNTCQAALNVPND